MIPILFPAAATVFTDVRRQLADAISCTVRQGSGGYDELSMRYPMIGAHFSELQRDAIILAKPNPHLRAQPYRIYDISRPMSGLVTVSARHIAYDMRGIPVAPFTASSAQDAAQKLKSKALTSCPFTITTDIDRTKAMEIEVPKTMRELLVTDSDSMLNLYGGGLVFDFYSVSLLASPGADRGVTIRYGVDLVDAQQEENLSSVYTGVLPWWQGMKQTVTPSTDPDIDDEITEETVTVMGDVCRASGTFPVEKILPVDMSEFFEEPPTKVQLNIYGADYVIAHKVGKPVVSLRVMYADLGQDVRLYDTVTVDFPLLGVSTTATVSSVEFDSLLEVCTAVEIGAVQTRITDSLTDASRLKKGKIPKQRIARYSIGGDSLARGGVSAEALAALAVTREKLAALAVDSSKIKPNAVTAAKLQDGAVIADKIAAGAVLGAKLADGAVESKKIAAGAVTEGKIANDAVSGSKIAAGAIENEKIAAGAVTGSKLADGSVESKKIAAGAVTEGKLANDAVTVNKIQNGAIVSSKLGSGSVISDKIAAEAVVGSKLADGAVSADKISDYAVTGEKILNQAISYAKLDYNLQVFYTDVLAAIGIYSSFIHADGSIECSVLNVKNYIGIGTGSNAHAFRPGTFTISDTHAIVDLTGDYNVANSPVYNWSDVQIGETPDIYYTYSISNGGTETHRTYNLNTLVEFWE